MRKFWQDPYNLSYNITPDRGAAKLWIMAPRWELFLLSFIFIPAFGILPKPRNVTVDSVNFRNILRWSMPGGDRNRPYTYRTQYKLNVSYSTFRNICISDFPECDFSDVQYESVLRVRAEIGQEVSKWSKANFDPYTQTILTAPDVKVSPRGGTLDVTFTGPNKESDGSTLKGVYGGWHYRLLYWKESHPDDVKTIVTSQNYESLPDLDRWTTYCIKVQGYAFEYDNAGLFSPVVCESTSDTGKTPVWIIALAFILSMLLATVAFLALYHLGRYTYERYIFFPSYSFPQHLKEYLNKPFHGPSHVPPQTTEEPGDSYEALVFVTEENETQTEDVPKQPLNS
uniref:Tissue factor n=1 Tax=Leptobrachium leishanense TaxID=445787 RepID=A0A8C5MDW4_9ANUR